MSEFLDRPVTFGMVLAALFVWSLVRYRWMEKVPRWLLYPLFTALMVVAAIQELEPGSAPWEAMFYLVLVALGAMATLIEWSGCLFRWAHGRWHEFCRTLPAAGEGIQGIREEWRRFRRGPGPMS